MSRTNIHLPRSGPLAILLGAMIGVGFFGLPFVGVHAGFLTLAIAFLVVGSVVYIVNRAYAEVIVGTNGKHRLPGYVERYLGSDWKHLAFATSTLGLWGALISYLLLGSHFLAGVFQPLIGGSTIFYLLLFFVAGLVLVGRGAKIVARVELLFVGLFIGLIVLLAAYGIPHLDGKNLTLLQPKNALLPYGLVLFALWGANVLPDVSDLVEKNKRRLNWIIRWSLIIASTLFFLFAVLIGGLSGSETTRDGLSGLQSLLQGNALLLAYLLGFFPTFMSFLALGLDLKKIFVLDYGFHEIPSLLLTFGIPLALILAGVSNFLSVIAIIGSVVLGLEGYVILRTYERFAKERKQLHHPGSFPLLMLSRPVRFILALGVLIGLLTPYLISRL
jgi:amino acid permease